MSLSSIKVAIQGVPGANHDIAARAFFSDRKVELVPCMTFHELFETIKGVNDTVGLVAIENTLVGSLLGNYTLIKDFGLKVMGEHKLRIKHQLMTLPGQSIYDVTEVHSHPMALAQCEAYFKQYPHIRLIESEDTALSAKKIFESQTKGVAAIASTLASKLYGLEIIAKDIETNKHNFTRFLVVGKDEQASAIVNSSKINKSSLVLSLPHEEGSLSKILTILTFYKINLTKIQSLPIVGKEWEYLFYIDVMFDDYTRYRQSLDAIIPLCRDLRDLGEYAAADVLYETNGGDEAKRV
ncbi:prephenate dehydratase [Geofilum sp. OHC36d9]|uniref:prephenate dehydratase n=1 Tax=Geofilum sp. OHC36d9 TaxID=3458413 RepID=UPI0040345E88